MSCTLGDEAIPLFEAISRSTVAFCFGFLPSTSTRRLSERLLRIIEQSKTLAMFECEQWKKKALYRRIQRNVERNDWIEKMRCAIEYKVTTVYKRAKLILVGQGAAGKTSTARSLLGRSFEPEYVSTIVGNADAQIALHDIIQ